jgi:hypothetical protein
VNRQSSKRLFLRLRAALDESLFPSAPQPQPPTGRPGRGLLALAFAALVVLQLFRPGWSVALNSLWAEDGTVFLHGALTGGFGHTLLSPYTNYLVVVPHLIAEFAGLAPLRDAPAGISILSACAVCASGLAVWYGAAGHIRNPYLRGGLAIFTVLAPMSGLESLVSASYVSWYMLFGTFWLLLSRPRTAVGTSLSCLFILATALSNPGVWFFIPLAALRGIAIQDRHDAAIVSCFALGAVVQMPVLALNHEPHSAAVWTNDIWVAYLQRAFAGGFLGLELAGHAWRQYGWKFLGLGIGAGAVALAIGWKYSTSKARWLTAVAIPTSLVMFVVSAYQRDVGTVLRWPEHTYSDAPSRYVMAPALLLVGAGVALLDGLLRRRAGPRGSLLLGGAALAVMTLGVVTSFDMEEPAGRGTPSWPAGLRHAARVCTTEHRDLAAIPISPPIFRLVLPCDQVASFAPSQERARPGSPRSRSR